MNIVKHGVYHISDQFFADFPAPYLKTNKNEKRPHYFCFIDTKTGLYWVIPFTSQPAKKADYDKRLKEGKKTDVFHPTALDRKDGVLLIADMFPVSEMYIASEYEISGVPVVFKDMSEIKAIEKKFKKVLALIRKGIKFTPTQPDVLAIEKSLTAKLDSLEG